MSFDVQNAGQATWHDHVRRFQARLLRSYLRRYRGCCGDTASALGVHRNTLTRLMTDLDIDPMDFRELPNRVKRPRPEKIRKEGEPVLRELIAERDPPLTKKERVERMMYLVDVLSQRRSANV